MKSNSIYKFEVIVLDPNELKVDNITEYIKHSLATINCDAIIKHHKSGKVMNYSRLELIPEDGLNDLLCDWELFSEYTPELNKPVLFIYRGNIYSGWYYKDAEDEITDRVSYAINIPDQENELVEGSFKAQPTHWMYANYIKMPII